MQEKKQPHLSVEFTGDTHLLSSLEIGGEILYGD